MYEFVCVRLCVCDLHNTDLLILHETKTDALHAALDCGPDISLALNNGAASTDLSANVTQAHGLTILTGQTLVPELAGGPLVRSCS